MWIQKAKLWFSPLSEKKTTICISKIIKDSYLLEKCVPQKNGFWPPGKYKSKQVNNKLGRVFYDLSYNTNIKVSALLLWPKHRFEVRFLFLPVGYTNNR